MPRAPDFDGDERCGSTIDRATGKGASILGIKSRNWLITQNNANKYGVDMSRGVILQLLQPLIEKSRISAIVHTREQSLTVDSAGNHTLHDHIAMRFPTQAYGSQVHKYFPHAALLPCDSNFISIVKYIQKDPTGAWYQSHPEKLGEKLPSEQANYWEWGDIPVDTSPNASKKDTQAGTGGKLDESIIAAIRAGKSDAEIMIEYPYSWRRPAELRKTRFSIMSAKYRSVYRDLTIIYVQANTPPKQLHALYPSDRDTYVVSDYTHPWDSYCAEKTVVLLEFVGQLPWPELRRLMSGNYCTLPARFSDAVACYTTLIIISPISFQDFMSIKTYESNKMESYLTHIRIYDDLDDLGSFFARDQKTLRWTRQYLLSSSSEDKKED